MKTCRIYRFDEKEFFYKQILHNSSDYITPELAREMVENMNSKWNDLSFKFYSDGSVQIIDNNSNEYMPITELEGACRQFYLSKRLAILFNDMSNNNKELAV